MKEFDLESERLGIFASKQSLNLDISLGREFLKKDNPQFVHLYRVNLVETEIHDLYGEVKSDLVKYFPPVKLYCYVSVEDNENKRYDDDEGALLRDETGDLIINVYIDELKEKQITDLKVDDILSYNFSGKKNRFYKIHNPDMTNDVTSKGFGGYSPYYRTIVASPVRDEFIIRDLLNNF